MSEEEFRKLMDAELEKIGWLREGVGQLGSRAEIPIPAGYRFTPNAAGMLEFTGNIPGGSETGVIGPEDLDWWVLFRFDDVGYVKDDEKDQIGPAQ